MDRDRGSDVSGPLATTVIPSLGISVASSRTRSMLGSEEMTSVTRAENPSRSTASAPPAGTRTESAMRIRIDPSFRSSSLRSQDALNGWSDLRELLQTISASLSVVWAGVLRNAIDTAYGAGSRAAGKRAAAAPDDVAREAARVLVGPLRERIVAVLDDADPSTDPSTIVERIGARYREWKNESVVDLVGDVLALGWSRGVFDSSPDGQMLRWIAADEGRCADCDAKYSPPTPAWFSIAAIYASGAVFVGSLGAARFIPEFLGPGENAARVGVAAVFLLLSLGALAVVVTAAVALYKWRGVSALPSTDFRYTAHCDAWGEFRPERRWE